MAMLGVAMNRAIRKPPPDSMAGWKVSTWANWTPQDPAKKTAFYIDVLAIHEEKPAITARIQMDRNDAYLFGDQETLDAVVLDRMWKALRSVIPA